MQRLPPVQGARVPHRQTPVGEHESAWPDTVQSLHIAPGAPQVLGESVVHTLLGPQQPVGHEVASHTQ